MRRPLRALCLIFLSVLLGSLASAQTLPPNVNYSAIFGGSLEDGISAIAVDAHGNVWVTGSTRSADLSGIVQAQERHVPNYDSDGFVAKFTPGGELIFAHYLGGTADDEARGIALDTNGNAFVVGTSSSADFPLYESDAPRWRAFVAYISADGQVIRPARLPAGAANAIATSLDGEFWVAGETETIAHAWVAKIRTPGDGYIEVVKPQEFGSTTDRALAIAVDAAGNGYFTGETSSPDFPTTSDATQAALSGIRDAFLLKLAPDATVLFSTYIGFGTETSGHAIALDGAKAYVFGTHNTGDSWSAFLTQFDGATLVSSRFVGGSGNSEGNGVAVDGSGFAVLAGKTNSPDFIFYPNCAFGVCYDAFVYRPDSPGIAARLGGQGTSRATSIVNDGYGNLLVAGMTEAPSWPVTNGESPQQGPNGFLMRFAVEMSAPDVRCDTQPSPTWSAMDIEISCSSDDSGSGLADVADSNFALKTSVIPGTETDAAETDSRKICDHAGNCAQAGPYAGWWVDKKAPAIVINLKLSYTLHELVTADYSCTDGGSGVATCVGPIAPGANLDTATPGTKTFTVDATDHVGNAASTTVTYEVIADSTAPIIRCASADQLWHRDVVTIACTAEDTASGLANASDANFVLTAIAAAGIETLNAQTDTRNLCDNAGNCATAGPVNGIHMDAKPPTLTRTGLLAVTTSWSANDVSLQYTAADAGSGLANMADALFSIFTSVPDGSEVAGAATRMHVVCDNVGNCATAGPEYFNIDKKAPSITVAAPNGQSYLLNESVTATFSCADGGSGVASCSSAQGNVVPTSAVGTANFTVKAADRVGHSASVTTSYEVIYKVRLGYDPSKEVKGGTYPVKLQVTDVNGVNLSSATVMLTAVAVVNVNTGTMVPASGTFRYDRKVLDSGGYILNLDTTGLAAGSYALLFHAGANAYGYSAPFRVR